MAQIREAVGGSPFEFQDDELAILVSHDCDIVHRDLRNEPTVEWLCVRPVIKVDGFYLHGKNPRRLHFEHDGKSYEGVARRRFGTPRELLLKFSAGSLPPLSKKLTSQIANWIAKRYKRPAFPDEFNKRVDNRAIGNIIDKAHEFLRRILISVRPPSEELPAGQPYAVSLVGVMARDDYEDAGKREACQGVICEVESLLSGCEGINVEDCMLRPDTEVSLADLDYLVEWDFDHLTVADESIQKIAAS
jgi:hypothetical protein